MLDALADLFLPRTCSGCGGRGTRLCPGCRSLLHARPVPVSPDPRPPGLPAVLALGPYDGPLQQLLLAHKERAALHLTRPLGEALARAVVLLDRGPLVVCPVPSSPGAVRSRGYDHAVRLARATAAALGAHGTRAVGSALLQPARRTADQAGLTSLQRAANLRGAMLSRTAPAARVVVVDDVMTTGSTLQEAARALAEAGHEVLGAVVVAATTRRRPPTGRKPFTEGPRGSSVCPRCSTGHPPAPPREGTAEVKEVLRPPVSGAPALQLTHEEIAWTSSSRDATSRSRSTSGCTCRRS